MLQPQARLSYEDSCKSLQRFGCLGEVIPPLPARRPRHDKGPLGVSFVRTNLGAIDLENLSLPRTFFGKSEIGPMSFRNTDLSESKLCWCVFKGVDFTDCDLRDCDLRASRFIKVKFVRATLRNADLRRSSFEDCDFTDAELRGAKLTYLQGLRLVLSEGQKEVIDWRFTDGEVPEGG
jgi:uncharacterized protein YjbI with pentapeptide repeats